MIVFQLVLYCLLFTVMVKVGVGNGALNVYCISIRGLIRKKYMRWGWLTERSLKGGEKYS